MPLFYTTAKWVTMMALGAFSVFHGADAAAVACFSFGALQGLLAKWSRA